MQNEVIKELLKSPTNKTLINKATLNQNRVAFHSEYNDTNPYKETFANWCKSMIDKSKWDLFDNYFVTPHSNLNFTTKIYEQYQKIFNARNSYSAYSFKNANHSDEFKLYLSEIDDNTYWKTNGFRTLESKHNSIVIITNENNKPHYFNLDIKYVHDVSDTTILEYVIYKDSKDSYICYDDEKVSYWELKDGNYIFIDEEYHNLGFCPAVWFWNTDLNDNHIVKEHPLNDSLGELDWLLFNEISKNHSDLYSLYPIVTGYVDDCDYSDGTNHCEGGYLVKTLEGGKQVNVYNGQSLAECPICGTSKLSGAGTFFGVTPPNAEDSSNNLEAIKFISANSDNIRLIEEKIIAKQEKLYIALTGASKQLNEAVNEKQILSANSDKETILSNLAFTFSLVQKRTNDMLAKIMYDDFNGSDVNYGNKFYIFTVEDLFKIYTDGIKNGYSESLLQDIRMQIIETEDKSNLKEYERKLMLLALEPLPYLSIKERVSFFEKGLLLQSDVIIQNYFMYFITQFELEKGEITNFEKEKDFNTRINLIKSELTTYASSKIKKDENRID